MISSSQLVNVFFFPKVLLVILSSPVLVCSLKILYYGLTPEPVCMISRFSCITCWVTLRRFPCAGGVCVCAVCVCTCIEGFCVVCMCGYMQVQGPCSVRVCVCVHVHTGVLCSVSVCVHAYRGSVQCVCVCIYRGSMQCVCVYKPTWGPCQALEENKATNVLSLL